MKEAFERKRNPFGITPAILPDRAEQDEYQVYELKNGIRVAHKQVSFTKIAHCGIMIDIGGRDEKPGQQGLVHFWEHMAFKGTAKRRSHHIINSLERVGGELNAYTTKEKICFHASVLDLHFERAVDILTDISFSPVFPEKQISRERTVILEEMTMYEDSPEDAIQDDLDALIFPNHSLGNNLLGTAETVSHFKREDLLRFIDEHIDTQRIVFAVVSRQPFHKIVRIAEKYLGSVPQSHQKQQREAPKNYSAMTKSIKKEIAQAQCAIGRPAYSLTDQRRLPFFLLVNILGGPGMNSRFNMALREKHGFVYSIEANFTPFNDCGHFGIFFGTEKRQLEKSIHLVQKELRQLKERPLTSLQLHHAKEQLMGQLAMAEESNGGYMLMMAKSLLDTGRVDSLSEIFNEIRAIEAVDLQTIANDIFDEPTLSYLTYQPAD